VSPELRSYAARRAKDEAEVDSMRTRSRGLQMITDGLVAGGLPKAPGDPKGKGKGKDGKAAAAKAAGGAGAAAE